MPDMKFHARSVKTHALDMQFHFHFLKSMAFDCTGMHFFYPLYLPWLFACEKGMRFCSVLTIARLLGHHSRSLGVVGRHIN